MASLNDQLEEVRMEIAAWQKLVDDPQYKKLLLGLREQVRARQSACYGLLAHSLDALISMGSVNAEVVGLESAMAYPQVMIDDFKRMERSLLEQINVD